MDLITSVIGYSAQPSPPTHPPNLREETGGKGSTSPTGYLIPGPEEFAIMQ